MQKRGLGKILGLVLLFGAACRWGSGGESGREVEIVHGGEWIRIPREEIVEVSRRVLERPDLEVTAREVILRIQALGLEWDIGAMVYQPREQERIPLGADGKKAGIFILHGGSSDHRSKDRFARFLVAKYGFKVVSMSYPGRLYLQDPGRDWPGDTIHPDGSVRTPIWKKDELITPDQYEVVYDREESRRRRWGTLILACAREGTRFYDRMAGWPVAFEEGARELMGREFPPEEYSVYGHGHSTGGPFILMLSQRVPNMAGIAGMESSPFGYMYGAMLRESQDIEDTWGAPFNCLRIRTWRDTARYAGYEAIEQEGVQALARLPMLMEEVLEDWEKGTHSPHFKAENMIHFDAPEALEEAARATARRLGWGAEQTQQLVERYLGYLRELRGEGVRPVPNLLLVIAKNSRDHTPESYRNVYLPRFAAMDPPPRVRVVQAEAGIHGYSSPEPDLPMGIAPLGAELWYQAMQDGFYHSSGAGP